MKKPRNLGSERVWASRTGETKFVLTLEGAYAILDAGKQTIYNSKFYENAATKFGSREPAVIAQKMALTLAIKDFNGALFGGIVGAFAGPEAIIPAACLGGIKNSATGALDMFSQLWFGPP